MLLGSTVGGGKLFMGGLIKAEGVGVALLLSGGDVGTIGITNFALPNMMNAEFFMGEANIGEANSGEPNANTNTIPKHVITPPVRI